MQEDVTWPCGAAEGGDNSSLLFPLSSFLFPLSSLPFPLSSSLVQGRGKRGNQPSTPVSWVLVIFRHVTRMKYGLTVSALGKIRTDERHRQISRFGCSLGARRSNLSPLRFCLFSLILAAIRLKVIAMG